MRYGFFGPVRYGQLQRLGWNSSCSAVFCGCAWPN